VASIYLLVRGILRALDGSGDLAYGYAGFRAWRDGLDPYAVESLRSEHLAGGGSLAGIAADFTAQVHPPSALPLFLPVSLTTWDEARLLALIVNIVLVFVIVVGLVRFLGWSLTSAPSLLITAFLLALAPVHTTIASGQSGIAITAALVWAMVLEGRHPFGSGLLLGISTAFKVTMGLPFMAYALVRRRWSMIAVAGLAIGALLLIAVLRMEVAGVPWLQSWTDNVARSFEPGGINSASLESGGNRNPLVNLQYPLSTLLGSESQANLLTLALVGAGALLTVLLVSDKTRPGLLLGMSLVAVLTLLVTYHRYYDAVLLAFPIAWGTWAFTAGRRVVGVSILLVCATFLLPLQTAAGQLEDRLPSALTETLLWEAGLMAVHAWALVALVVLLLVAAVGSRATHPATEADAASPISA
jgi:uncharacterized membrane protein